MPCPTCNPCNTFLPLLSAPIPPCVGCEQCGETDNAECIVYKGPNLPSIHITDGMRLREILAVLNKYAAAVVTTNYQIVVAPTLTARYEYINASGAIVSVTVTGLTSPVTIVAQTNSPVLMSGTGTITVL